MYIIPVTLTKDQYIDLCNLRAKAQRKAEKASLKAKAPSSRAHAAALQCEFMSIAAVVTQISRAMENVQNGATDATHVLRASAAGSFAGMVSAASAISATPSARSPGFRPAN